jgi:glycosyltransferase involved in cell wall biosynthesis
LEIPIPENTRIITPEGFAAKRFPSMWRSFGLAGRVQKDKIDIYHGLSNELPSGIAKSGIKSVVTIHDLIFFRYPELYKPIDRMIYTRKLEYCVKSADMIITVSEQTRNDLLRFSSASPGKITVAYQSCNQSYLIKADENKKSEVKAKYLLPEKYLLYVGTIEERKNLLTIVKALYEGRIDIPLLVIGKETPYASTVKSYIENKGMKTIHFLKNIPNEDLPVIYQMSEIFIYPSSFEGFGIPVLEALNSGVPVIAGQGSCLEETGGESSVYINPLDSGELAESIVRILNSPDLRKKMVSAGYIHAEKFSQENTINELNKVYEGLI